MIHYPKPFVVIDSGKLACYRQCSVDRSWNRCQFKTLAAANLYAQNWLGAFHNGWLVVGVPYHYTGTSDYIVILDKRIHNIGQFIKERM
jgi:hypothetical protein